jgi:hypothetical protein
MMNERIRAITCPKCGAPISMPENGGRLFACEFCGSTLEDRTTPEERETGSYPRLVIHSTAALTTVKPLAPAERKRAKRITWLTLLLIIVPVLVAVGIAVFVSGTLVIGGQELANQISSRRIYGFGVSQLLPGGGTNRPDIVAVARFADETNRMVYVDFESDPPDRWVSESLGEDADYVYNRISHDQNNIYLAHETTLTALGRADGIIKWQVTLSDEISTICQECLQVFRDTLVALTSDGMLSGYGTLTGDTIWNIRLNSTPRQLMNLAGRAGILDEENSEVGIQVIDPKTGDLIQRILPACPNEIFPDSPQTLGIYDQVFISSDGEKLFVPIHDYEPGCIQAWDIASLTQLSEISISGDVLESLDWGTYLFTDKILYVSVESNLFYINLEEGDHGLIYSKPDYDLTPIASHDEFVLVLAEKTRGTTQYSLLGIDTESKVERWEFKPTAQDVYESGSSVVHEEGIWYAGITTEEVAVFEAFSEPATASISVLNQSDGAPISTSNIQFDEYDSSYWLQILGWHEGHIYMVTSDVLRWIDGATGTQLGIWP